MTITINGDFILHFALVGIVFLGVFIPIVDHIFASIWPTKAKQ